MSSVEGRNLNKINEEQESILIKNLDNISSIKINDGENYHKEYSWIENKTTNINVSDFQEELIQIFFQCVRTDFVNRYEIAMKFKKWVSTVFLHIFNKNIDNTNNIGPIIYNNLVSVALYGYKLIAQLRDIKEGKGEYRFAYDMLYAYYEGLYSIYDKVNSDYKQELIKFNEDSSSMLALEFIRTKNQNEIQYGSYKDYKYLCHEFALLHLADEISPDDVYIRYMTHLSKNHRDLKKRNKLITFRFTPEIINYLSSHPIISVISAYYGTQIYNDFININSDAENIKISLAGKWAPRISSKLFAPLRKLLFPYVIPEYNNWITSAITKESKKKAELKIETNYRKRLSEINKILNTVQVKQCNNKWSEIDFDNDITSITLQRQKKAFMKVVSNKNKEDNNTNLDRKKCYDNFISYLQRINNNNSVAKGNCISVTDYVKEAKNLLLDTKNILKQPLSVCLEESKNIENEKMLLDKQWESKGKNINNLENFIAMVDTSGSMEYENSYALDTAIGLGIRIAEKSLLGNRVMTFSDTPTWINLNNTDSFTERVNKVMKCDWGYNTNFYAAMNLILIAIINAKLTAKDVSNLTLVILSDMQMDEADENFTNKYSTNHKDVLFNKIKQNYINAGIQEIGEPYKVPKIVFWNLRKTNGFPCVSTDERSIMISGGSDIILNDICEKGINYVKNINSWNIFTNILKKSRYGKLDKYFNNLKI